MPQIPKRIKDKCQAAMGNDHIVYRLIRVETYDDRTVSVEAKVMGLLAAHKSTSGPHYVVTHIPTSRVTGAGENEQEAIEMMSHLWGRYRSIYEIEDRGEIVRKMPNKVKDWIKRCIVEKRFIRPAV